MGAAARTLDEQRRRWVNPPEWIEPIAAAVDAEDDFADVPEEARALIRHSAIMAAAAKDGRLKKRTLTNLYNQRPTWLRLAYRELDPGVLAAYAAVHPLAARRAEVDQTVLGDLLRLNLAAAADAPA